MKHLILVTSPPASGKTFISRELAKVLKNCVYLDKDSLIVLSKQIFKVANEEYNRSSQFFEDNIRNYEYDAIMAIAFEALAFNDTVLINAPFTREIKDEKYIKNLKAKLKSVGAELFPIWVHCNIDTIKKRMIDRNSPRDTWKIKNWDEYAKSREFKEPKIDNLFIVNNSTTNSYKNDLKKIMKILKR